MKCRGVTHKYGAQNGCFDDPPQSVVNYIPASARGDEDPDVTDEAETGKEASKNIHSVLFFLCRS